jgi:hypothetical protein
MPLETKTLFVGLLVGLAHIASGIAVLVAPSSLAVTPLEAIRAIADFLEYQRGGFVGATLVLAGLMAVVAGSRGLQASRIQRAVLFAPQQILLLLQLGSISWAWIIGTYPDGYSPQGGAWFILADQIWAWLLAVSHSVWLAAFIYGSAPRGSDS